MIEHVREFIKTRSSVKPKRPQHPSQALKKEFWEMLNEDEKTARIAAYDAQLAEIEATKAEEKAKDAEVYFAKEP